MKSITLPRAIKPRLHRNLIQQMKKINPVKGDIISVKDEKTGETKNFRIKGASKDGTSIELEEAE